MLRRSFLSLLPLAGLLAKLRPRPAEPRASTYPTLRSNIWAQPRPLTEEMLRESYEAWRDAR